MIFEFDFLLKLILPLLHRLSVFILLTSTIVYTILPDVFHLEEENQFAHQVSKILDHIISVCFTTLVLTGILRLQFGIPNLIEVKIILVLCTLFVNFNWRPDLFSDQFVRIQIGKLSLIIITTIVGLLL